MTDQALAEIRQRHQADSLSLIRHSDQAVRDVGVLLNALTEAQRQIDKQRGRAIVAEHHKSLSLLGKSSWQEKVEDDLRVQLAETQVALDAAEARAARMDALLDEIAQLPRVEAAKAYASRWDTPIVYAQHLAAVLSRRSEARNG